jgi:hypothetical protein
MAVAIKRDDLSAFDLRQAAARCDDSAQARRGFCQSSRQQVQFESTGRRRYHHAACKMLSTVRQRERMCSRW